MVEKVIKLARDYSLSEIEDSLHLLFANTTIGSSLSESDRQHLMDLEQSPYFKQVFNKLTNVYGEPAAAKVFESIYKQVPVRGTEHAHPFNNKRQMQQHQYVRDRQISDPSLQPVEQESQSGVLSNLQGTSDISSQYEFMQGMAPDIAENIKDNIDRLAEIKSRIDMSEIQQYVDNPRVSLYKSTGGEVGDFQKYLPEDIRGKIIGIRDELVSRYKLDPYVARLLIFSNENILKDIQSDEYYEAALDGLKYVTGTYSRGVYSGDPLEQQFSDKVVNWFFNNPNLIPHDIKAFLNNSIGPDWQSSANKRDVTFLLKTDEEIISRLRNVYNNELIQNKSMQSTLINWASNYGVREILKRVLSDQSRAISESRTSNIESIRSDEKLSDLRKNKDAFNRFSQQFQDLGDTLTTELKNNIKDGNRRTRMSETMEIYSKLMQDNFDKFVNGKMGLSKNDDVFSEIVEKIKPLQIMKEKRKIGKAINKIKKYDEDSGGKLTDDQLSMIAADSLLGKSGDFDENVFEEASKTVNKYKNLKKLGLDNEEFLDEKYGWYFKDDKNARAILSDSFGVFHKIFQDIYNSGKFDQDIVKSYVKALRIPAKRFKEGGRYQKYADLYKQLVSGNWAVNKDESKIFDQESDEPNMYIADSDEDAGDDYGIDSPYRSQYYGKPHLSPREMMLRQSLEQFANKIHKMAKLNETIIKLSKNDSKLQKELDSPLYLNDFIAFKKAYIKNLINTIKSALETSEINNEISECQKKKYVDNSKYGENAIFKNHYPQPRDLTDLDYEEMQNYNSEISADVVKEYNDNLKNEGYRQSWTVVPAQRLKKIWIDYASLGFVRDVKGMNLISGIIIENIFKINVNNILTGHAPVGALEGLIRDELELDLDHEHFDKAESFFDDDKGAWRISDYAIEKLMNNAYQLRFAKNAEEQLLITDRILNIVHCRSDLASWFVEGGSRTLDEIYGACPIKQASSEQKQGLPQLYRGDATPFSLADYDPNKGLSMGKELGSSMAEGPGIYFTTDEGQALSYGKNVTRAAIRNGANILVPGGKKLSLSAIKRLLSSVDKEILLTAMSNWDENQYTAKLKLIDAINQADDAVGQIINIWADVFYHQNPKEFLRIMVSNGIDGVQIPKDGLSHYVIYNSAILD